MSAPIDDVRPAVRGTAETLALALRAGRMGWWTRDLTTNAVEWSPELEAIFGIEPGTFEGTEAAFFSFVHPDDRAPVKREVESAIAERRDYVIEFRFRHAEGSWRWMEGRGRAVDGEDGAPRWLHGVGLDITDRHRAEERLAHQAGEIQRLYDAARRFSSTLDLPTLYRAFRELASEAVPCDGLVVSAVDHDALKIRCVYAWVDGVEHDPATLPLLDFNPRGEGMQTEVIRTGESRLFADVAKRVQRPGGNYYELDDDGKPRRIGTGAKPPDTRAALMVPLKLGGRVTGVVQVMTDGDPGFRPEHLTEIEALSGPLAVAAQNAVLFADAERELAERRRYERRLAVEHAVTRILSDSATLDDAAPSLLASLCRPLEFSLGALWLVDEGDQRLRCVHMWDDGGRDVAAFRAFSLKAAFERGVGLPGRVWEQGEPVWVADFERETQFPRSPLAAAAGLHSAFSFPIPVDGRVLGAIEVFAPNVAPPDPALLEMARAIGAEIGLWVEKRRVEQDLRVSEENMRLALAAAPLTLLHFDRDLRYTWIANPPGHFANVSFIGKRDSDMLAPEEAQPLAAMKRRVLDSGHGETQELTLTVSGRKRSYLICIEPKRDAAGAIVGLTEVAYDISPLKDAQEELRHANALLRAVSETTDDMVFVKDRDSRMLFVNPAFLKSVGRPAEEVMGRTEADWHHDRAEVATMLDNDRRVLESGRSESVEEVFTGPLGARTYLSLKSPMRDEHGAIIGLIGIARDITERKRLEERLRRTVQQLEEADRQKDEFLATLAHELRNPLAPIRNAVRLLRSSGEVDPDVRWSQDVIDRQVTHMARLLDDLLDVSRITRGQLELRKQRVELSALVESAIETSRPLIDGGRHALEVRLPAEPVFLHADAVRIAQVFANLLNNAAKYTDPGGRIELEAAWSGRDVVVTIRDSGIGIAPEMLPRLFRIFSQAPSAVGRAQGGLGIGLSLVRGLVELHGGTVEASSDGEQRGSTFVVRLPGQVAEAVAEPVAGADAPASPGREVRVLVADDFRDSAESLAKLIERGGYTVRTAFDGEEAIAALDEFRPDAMVLDLGMPKRDGLEVARWARQQPWGGEAIIVALTGWGQDADRRRTTEAGFDHHLVKPVDAARILQILGEVAKRPRAPRAG